MIRVAGHAIADNLGEDWRVALLRVFERLKNQNSRALANHKSIAAGIPRAAGASRIVIARRKSFHGGESAHAHRSYRRFGTAADHHLRGTAFDDFEGIANGMR